MARRNWHHRLGWLVAGALAAAAVLPGAASAFEPPLVGSTDPVHFDRPINLSQPQWGISGAGKYLAGRHAEKQQDLVRAIELLETALGFDPNHLALRQHVFFLMLLEGELEDAAQHARAIVRQEPDAFLPLIALAVLDIGRGQHETARQRLSALDASGHVGLMRTLMQAWASVGAGDLDTARTVLDKPLEADGWDSIRPIQRVLIEDVGGGDAAKAYENVLGSDGATPRLQDLHANFQARQTDPSVEPLIGNAAEGVSQAFATIAGALVRGDRHQSGLIYARLGLALTPGDVSLLLLTANALQNQERYVDAASIYAQVAPASGFYYPAQVAKARNLARAERNEEAIQVLKPLKDSEEARLDALTLLGDIFRGEQRFEEAAAAYDAAFASNKAVASQDWRLLYTRGIARERTGNWAGAEADLKAAPAINEEHPLVLNYLGYSWIDRGEHLEKATAMVRRAAELRPDDGFIADSVGWAAYRTGDYETAVKELERAVTLEPVDPIINEHLGDAYWKVGRRTEARYQWQRALTFDPEKARIEDLNQRIRCGLRLCKVGERSNRAGEWTNLDQ